MAHILNLVVKDGLKAYKKEVDTIALAVKYIKHSSQRVTNFKESVENACASSKFLISECPTRWNSTHDMLKTAIELKDAFFDYDFNNSCFARDLEEIPKLADYEVILDIDKHLREWQENASFTGMISKIDQNKVGNKLSGGEDELTKYLKEPRLELDDDEVFDILNFGKLNGQDSNRIKDGERCIMPSLRDVDHHDTAHYIPMYHRTRGFTGHEREIYKSLVNRLFHEGRVVLLDFLESEPNLRTTFAAIGFDYNVETVLTLKNFGRILRIPYEGVCLYSSEWSISSLQRSCDPHPNHYPPPHEDPSVVHDALFHPRAEPKTRTIKSDSVTLEPFQMINNELRENFKKWEIILSDNAISLTGHKDYPNISLCYMLYCLTTGKPFNLAYFIAHRMVSVTQSSQMTLPYAMLLTRLFKHVQTNHPYPLYDEFYLVDHVMIPLSSKRIYRFKNKGKRPRLLTSTPSNSSGSSQSPPN
ncbi:reverse transcriptase domain-containing protein [Tanacetum coccineum]